MEEAKEIDLDNPEFRNLWSLINYTDNSVFLTGKAGTGKSTFLKYITAHTRKRCVVLAPTGIAAVNAGGMTLHSFFNLPFKPLLPDDPEFMTGRLRSRMKYSAEKRKIIEKLELVIIDEISMVRADIIDFLDKLLRVYSRNMRVPFGGKQLLLVGDIFQLEPVVTPDMRNILKKYYPNSLFFNALVFKDMNIVSIELRKVYRQTDTQFISMLDRIRLGKATDSDISLLNNRLIGPTEGKTDTTTSDDKQSMTITLASRRDTVDYINAKRLDSLSSELMTFSGTITGEFPENALPTSMELELKEGAQVVFIKNDRSGRWVNGTIARIVTLRQDLLEVELENGKIEVIEKEIWSNVKYSWDNEKNKIIENVIGQFIQYPLKLAWALTIHKSQGLTFNNVVIDIGEGAFTSGQTYVALSRCRSYEGLSLRSTISRRDIFINPAVGEFSRQFNDPLLMKRALDRAHADDCYRRASEALDKGDPEEAFNLFLEAMKHRSELHNDKSMRLVRRKLGVIKSLNTEIDNLKSKLKDSEKKLNRLSKEYISMGYDCLEDASNPLPALANFEKALELNPRSKRAMQGKGEALKAMGEYEEAEKWIKKAKSRKDGGKG